MREHSVETADGRALGIVEGGDPGGVPVLGLETLAVWGISGGGPHALVCAALLPKRVAAAAALASVAPYPADGLDWLAGMGEANVAEFQTALRGREALEPLLAAEAEGLASASVEYVVAQLRSLLSPADAGVLTGELGAFLLESMRVGLARGVDGWVDDDLAFTRPWGFDLAGIGVPLLLVHGAQDRFVPIAHGRWLAEKIPGVEARFIDEDGRITLAERRIPDVHAWLLARAGEAER